MTETERGEETYLSIKQLARRWSMHIDTLRRWTHKGRGPASIDLGTENGRALIRYPISAVIEYEARNQTGANTKTTATSTT